MTTLCDKEIEMYWHQGELVIDPFLPENLNGMSYDLTLGPWFYRRRLFTISPDVYDRDQSHRFDLVDARESGVIELEPLESILAHTNEVVGGRRKINTFLHATSTAGRNDITACRCAGWGDPGFVNIWTLEVQNLGSSPLTLRVGTVIAQVVFSLVTAPDRVYGQDGHGQYSPSRDSESAMAIRAAWKPEQMIPKAMKVRDWRETWKNR